MERKTIQLVKIKKKGNLSMASAFGSIRQKDWIQGFETNLDNIAKCYLKKIVWLLKRRNEHNKFSCNI